MSERLVVVTPTRGRPDQFERLARSVFEHAHGPVALMSAVDDDDPADYGPVAGRLMDTGWDIYAYTGIRRSLSGWTNEIAQHLTTVDGVGYVASLGDDHIVRTDGWDLMLREAIDRLPGGHGFAFGNDLFQGANLPTAWVASISTVQALGWMMLPACSHMYVDTALLALGVQTGRITYRPDVIIEHMHPLAGKAPRDATYEGPSSVERFEADRDAYNAWLRDEMVRDARRLDSWRTS